MKRVKIDQKMFNCVKQLAAGGATIPEIADYMHIGTATVSRIKSAETWQEYQNILAAMALSYQKRKAKQKETEEKHEPPKQEAPKQEEPA